jgi:tetratricopeptide (TPR) repeat protein
LADHFESLSINAADRFKRAYGLAASLGDNEIRSLAAAWMAASEFLMAHYEAASLLAVEAIRHGAHKSPLALSRAHLVLANCLSLVADIQLAASHYKDARHFAIEARDISMQSVVLYNVAAFRIARISLADAFGEPTTDESPVAELELNSISNLDSGLGVDSLRAMVPLLRAQLCLTKNKWAEAEALYQQCIPEASVHGQMRETPRFYAEQAHCLAMLDRPDEATSAATKAVAQISGRTDLDDLAACHARLSLCFESLGIEAERTKHLETATRHLAAFIAFQEQLKVKVLAALDNV